MCTAIYAAVVLVTLIAALTVLRVREPSSPNAELLAEVLNNLESPGTGLGPDTPCRVSNSPSGRCTGPSPAILRS